MNSTLPSLEVGNHSYKNMVARFDTAQGIMWTYFDTRPRPCVTMDLLHEYLECQRLVTQVDRTALETGNDCPIRFLVLASKTPGIYSLGGDLHLFKRCIETRDRETLKQYAIGVHRGAPSHGEQSVPAVDDDLTGPRRRPGRRLRGSAVLFRDHRREKSPVRFPGGSVQPLPRDGCLQLSRPAHRGGQSRANHSERLRLYRPNSSTRWGSSIFSSTMGEGRAPSTPMWRSTSAARTLMNPSTGRGSVTTR